MKISTLPFILAATAAGANAQVNTVSAVRCFTKLGPSSTAKITTISKVLTLPLYAVRKRTVTPTSTITPAPVFVTTTGTVTVTATITATSDITSTTPAIVVSTTAGFQPIESTLAGAGDGAAAPGKRADLAPVLEGRGSNKVKTCRLVDGKVVYSPAVYPKGVTCAGLVLVVSTRLNTVTAASTVTITLPATTLVGETITTTTTTVTTTVTNTVRPPQATEYAACAANNLASQVNGKYFDGSIIKGSGVDNGDFAKVDAATPYDCCVACQLYSSTVPGQICVFSTYYPGYGCGLAVSTKGTCLANDVTGPYTTNGNRAGMEIIVSNGCLSIAYLQPSFF